MQRYILAFDLDGTACNDSGRLGEKTKQAFAAAQAKGHIICFATGRRDIDMVSLGMDYKCADYLLLNNGGKLVRTADDAILFNHCIEKSVCQELVRHCLQKDYVLHIVSGMYWRVNRWTQGLTDYVNALGAAPKLYHTAEELCLDAVEGMMATEQMEAVCAYIDAQKLPLLHVQSEPGCTDIMSAGITKWGGLQQMAALLGLSAQRIIAAGDFTNDLEMICGAEIGVAVRNALPAVQAAANYVTQNDNNHDAAAEIVTYFLLCDDAQTNIEKRRKT